MLHRLMFYIAFIALSLNGCTRGAIYMEGKDIKNALGGYQTQDQFRRNFEHNANTGSPKADFLSTLNRP
ncbi:MAG: hypothetical protein J1E28_06505 [Helicobacter sp.]|uniref:hypothetical protein n=1 Tax=Helicobacter sp. TaxID=218 RepID=UPI0025C09B0F|nr:hypothetical protein [Helicobacter sp.]MCH5314022.1 hypothetical protein [Helicobacter sp.]